MFRKGMIVLLAGLATLCVAGSALADNNSDSKTAFALARGGFDARALAMGGAYVGMTNDASAGFWNPAGLHMMAEKSTSLSAMYTAGLAFDRFANSIALAHRFDKVALGGTWLNTGIRDVPIYTDDNSAQNSFGNYENILIGSVAFGNEAASFGFSVKGYMQNLNSENRNGVGFDVGMQWKAMDMLTVGGVVQDLNAMRSLERVIAEMELPSRSGFERLQRPLSFLRRYD